MTQIADKESQVEELTMTDPKNWGWCHDPHDGDTEISVDISGQFEPLITLHGSHDERIRNANLILSRCRQYPYDAGTHQQNREKIEALESEVSGLRANIVDLIEVLASTVKHDV